MGVVTDPGLQRENTLPVPTAQFVCNLIIWYPPVTPFGLNELVFGILSWKSGRCSNSPRGTYYSCRVWEVFCPYQKSVGQSSVQRRFIFLCRAGVELPLCVPANQRNMFQMTTSNLSSPTPVQCHLKWCPFVKQNRTYIVTDESLCRRYPIRAG
jgi:hypothetical protein